MAVVGIPFWLTDLVLAGRFDVGVGGGGDKLGGPWAILTYLWRTAGDFSSGEWPVLVVVLVLALVGLIRVRAETRVLALCVVGVPVAAFLAARLGGSTSPESRHLIFVLPFFADARRGRDPAQHPRGVPWAAAAVTVLLVALEVSWASHRTPQLFNWEPNKRQATRAQAERFLAETSRPDDILFGYEPLFLGAWERNHDFPDLVVPRADAVLALRTLDDDPKPLGRGVWVLDASERNNLRPRLEIENRDPGPPGLFERRVYGPFLILRTREPVRTEDAYLAAAARAMLVGPLARDRRRRREHADDRARRPHAARLRPVGAPALRQLAVARAPTRRRRARRASPRRRVAGPQPARGGGRGGAEEPADDERPHLPAAPAAPRLLLPCRACAPWEDRRR